MFDRMDGFEKSPDLSIIDFANIPITLIDSDYFYTLANDCFCRAHGRGKEEILGRSVEEVWGTEAFRGAIKKSLDTCFIGKTVHDEAWMYLPALGRRYCEVVYSPFFAAGDVVSHAVVITYDITERKEAEEQLEAYRDHLEGLVEERTGKLQASEERLRSIYLNATEGIFQVTPEGHILSANPAFARIHGYPPLQAMSQEMDHADSLRIDPDKKREYLQLLDKNGQVRDFECTVCRKDGAAAWVSINARAVFDQTGRMLYHEGTIQDIGQRKRMEAQILIQRDLAIELGRLTSLDPALSLCLDMALQASGMACGAAYARYKDSRDLTILCSRGMSDDFEKKITSIAPGTPAYTLVMTGKPLYANLQADGDLPFAEFLAAGYRSLCVIPVIDNGHLVASFSLASPVLDAVPDYARATLELMAIQMGAVALRIEARQELERDIDQRKRIEKDLQEKSRNLEETNTALKVLLDRREADKGDLEETVIQNVRQNVLPHTRRLRESRLDGLQNTILDVVEGNLNHLVSPFLKRVRVFNFTPRELEVVSLIKEGKATKDIAAILQIGISAVDVHRYNIRKKLGINQLSTNLRSYLLSLD